MSRDIWTVSERYAELSDVLKCLKSKVSPQYVSCVIQINSDNKQWVSDSPYLHAFDRLNEVHHQMDEKDLSTKMQEIGYKDILQIRTPLPNGKTLLRMDFLKG